MKSNKVLKILGIAVVVLAIAGGVRKALVNAQTAWVAHHAHRAAIDKATSPVRRCLKQVACALDVDPIIVPVGYAPPIADGSQVKDSVNAFYSSTGGVGIS